MASFLSRLSTSWRGRLAAAIVAAPRQAVIAAASRVRLDDRKMKPVKPQEWQRRAWDFYDTIGLLKYAFGWKANAVSRVRFYPALQVDPMDEPVALSDLLGESWFGTTVDDYVVEQAALEIERIHDDTSDQDEVKREIDLNLSVAGECFLVGTPEDPVTGEPERWEVCSIDELRYRGTDSQGRQRYEIVDTPHGKKGRELDPDTTVIIRVWNKHPRWSAVADSAMRGVLNDCETFELLKAGNRAIASSRIANAGMLFLSNDLNAAPTVGQSATGNDPNRPADPFLDAVTRAMTTAIAEPGAASSVVPIVIRTDGNPKDKVEHVTLDRPLHEDAIKAAADAVVSIVRGLNVNPEIVFGIGESANYATARVITHESYTSHVDNDVRTQCSALTTGWLRPGAREWQRPPSPEFLRRLVVWRDPSPIIVHPNRGEQAIKLLDRKELSGEAARRANNFGEADAPTDEERARWETSPPMGRGGGELPAQQGSPDNPNGDDNLRRLAALRRLDALDVPSRPGRPGRPAAAITAAAEPDDDDEVRRRQVDRLGPTLEGIDRVLLARLDQAAAAGVRDALRLAGARLRGRAQGQPDLRALLSGVPAHHVVATLGPERVGQLATEDDDVLAGSLDDLEATWDEHVTAAQRRALAVLAATIDLDDDELAPLERQQDEDRAAGWALLAAALLGALNAHLFDPAGQPVTIGGEGDPDAAFSVTAFVRQAIGAAGGADGALDTSGVAGVATLDGQPGGLIGSGQLMVDTIRTYSDLVANGYTWSWGGAARPFEPHVELNGIDFTGWDDPALEADPSDFPYVTHSFPGDHGGCTCTAVIRWGPPGSDPATTLLDRRS